MSFAQNLISRVVQAAPRPPMSRIQKLAWYADQLMTDAANEEKAGTGEVAITKYLNASEILLALAKGEESYNSWKRFADKAAYCQQKARTLIALNPKPEGM